MDRASAFLVADSIFGWSSASFTFQGLPVGYEFDVVAGDAGLRLLSIGTPVSVPEPDTFVLLLCGATLLWWAHPRRHAGHARRCG